MTCWRQATVNAVAAVTRDGHVLAIRPITPGDFTALVALDHERIIATASYRQQGVAAVFVDPRHHGRGIATLLLKHLDTVDPTREPPTATDNRIGHLLRTYDIPTATWSTNQPRIDVRPNPTTVILAAAIERDTTGQAILRLQPATANATLANDRVYRPATHPHIATMWRSLRAAAILRNHAIDTGALEDLTRQLAHLALDHPEITELTLDPILAATERLMVIDAKLRLATTLATNHEPLNRVRLQHTPGLTGDLQILPSRDHQHRDPTPRRTDHPIGLSGDVTVLVNAHTQKPQTHRRSAANPGLVLPHTTGEHQRV